MRMTSPSTHTIKIYMMQPNKSMSTLTLAPYPEKKQFFVSTSKCTAMLFSQWTEEWNNELHIEMNNKVIPAVTTMNIQGVTLDRSLTFNEHAQGLNDTAGKRDIVLPVVTHRKRGLKR